MLHVRRAGPNTTDSLWLMGGISIENTTGNRYFDFEMYQTDIYYDRSTRAFYNIGPHAGHTRWQFDAGGNMLFPGDIILTAEYSSSALTNVEARIWIDRADLLKTPVGFSWTGDFDGASAGSQYGYAGIRPKTTGAFYTGLQSSNNTWAGPFGLVVGDNSLLTDYVARQYMEYSVNLSKLGLDQAQIFGGDDCQMPFRRVIVKTRASTSFTSELKDFVAPFDFFIAPKAYVETESPIICDTGSISHIYVANPIPTSVYEWTTLNGHIVTMPATGPSIYVDTAGVYIVKQYLQAGCSLYATDTITIDRFSYCGTLSNNLFDFHGNKTSNLVALTLKLYQNQYLRAYDIERSTDGVNFEVIQHNVSSSVNGTMTYTYSDNVSGIAASNLYYRIKFLQADSRQLVSNVVRFQLRPAIGSSVSITPNPVRDNMTIHVLSTVTRMAIVHVCDQMGKIIYRGNMPVQKGNNTMSLDILSNKPAGIYQVVVSLEDKVQVQRVIHVK